jgi:hypothetical protein
MDFGWRRRRSEGSAMQKSTKTRVLIQKRTERENNAHKTGSAQYLTV